MAIVLTAAFLFSGCPGPQGPCAQPKLSAEQQICDNCKTNLDVAMADLKQCAAGNAVACNGLNKDLAQIEQVSPPDKANVDTARAHAASCQGKGEGGAECVAARESLNMIQCK